MIFLYTIIPVEYIFDEEENNNQISQEKFQEIQVKKGQASIMCQSLPGGEMKVTRVISTNAQDYLKPEWQPGAILPK